MMQIESNSNRHSNLRDSEIHLGASATPSRVLVGALLAVGLLVSTPVMAQVENTQFGYAGAEAGDWGGQNGAVIGPADNTCANMGAVDKVNLVSNFGFSIPLDATITEVRAFTKAGASSLQNVGVQLASAADVDPPVTLGNEILYPFPDVGAGNCAVTVVSDVGNGLGFWGLASLDPAVVNTTSFGMVFVKKETSEVKVDSICMKIAYVTDEGPAVIEECFADPTNIITVEKVLVGAAPGDDWAYSGDLGDFTLPAAGGSDDFANLIDGSYTITETPVPGYTSSVECVVDQAVVASGDTEVIVDVAGGQTAVCTFTNTLNVGTFTVFKDYDDGNETAVTITASCTGGGSFDANDLPAAPGAPAEFVYSGYTGSPTCTAVESDVTPDYMSDNSDCQDNDALNGSCTIVNVANKPIPTLSQYSLIVLALLILALGATGFRRRT